MISVSCYHSIRVVLKSGWFVIMVRRALWDIYFTLVSYWLLVKDCSSNVVTYNNENVIVGNGTFVIIISKHSFLFK